MLRHVSAFALCAAALCLGSTSATLAQSAAEPSGITKPDDVRWGDPFGLGVAVTTLHGDPAKPGLFIQRIKFPPQVFDRPHFHNGDRHITVIKGTWYLGAGATWDPAKATALSPGSHVFQPANTVHWDGAMDEEVVLQVVGIGPAGSTLVNTSEPFLVRYSK